MPVDYRRRIPHRTDPAPAPAPVHRGGPIPIFVLIAAVLLLLYLSSGQGIAPAPGPGPSPGPGPGPAPAPSDIEWSSAMIVLAIEASDRSPEEALLIDEILTQDEIEYRILDPDVEAGTAAFETYEKQASRRGLGEEWAAVVIDGTKLAWMGKIPTTLEDLKREAEGKNER